ncbi:beta-phosphoglucomutase [Evansella tamaricis]|uniref:Beta-phosphoglucomutase n=1 Tax=Evansella tamaricis TaxID=2069301 RepID=A0ABS6JJP0_9BACI|nr:beta-phosphoglucomutase [Evansella tamaricis]MBU9712670.1 beta-phosphoglucomutase [Evansella tamaricis]
MTVFPKAFIFDLDGVITDTAEFHFLAWQKLSSDLGITINREFNEQLKGIGRMESLERILSLDVRFENLSFEEKERIASRKNEYYQAFIKTIQPDDILPGILPLLTEIKENKIYIALGSASRNATKILEQLHLTSTFDFVVNAASVSKGKPDPETFLTAANALNVPNADCIGIEDSAAGINAINGAGMFSVGVGNQTHLHKAHYLVDETSLLTFEDIIQQYTDWKN